MISSALLSKYSYGFDSISDEAEQAVRLAIEKAWGKGLSVAQVRDVAIEAIVAASDEYGAMTREMTCSLFERETGQAAAYVIQPTNRETVESCVRYYANSLRDGTEEGLERFVRNCTDRTRLLTRRCSNEAVIESCAASAKSARRRKGPGKGRGVRFARVPRGGDTCTFCAMLASRGFVYWSRKTAGEFNHYHLHCRCTIVPDDGSGEVEGYDPTEWYARWKAYEEIDSSERLNAKLRSIAKRYVSDGASPDASDAIERVLSEPVAASPVFLNKSSELYRRMKKVKPLEGYYDVMGHSDGYSLIYGDLNDIDDEPGTAFTMKELKAVIHSDESYKGGPIRVVACDAGGTTDGLAQKLADEMGVEVLAPTASVYVDYDGTMTLASSREEYLDVLDGKMKEQGRWVTFKPRSRDE